MGTKITKIVNILYLRYSWSQKLVRPLILIRKYTFLLVFHTLYTTQMTRNAYNVKKRPKSSKFYISGWLQKFVMVWTSFLGPPRIVRSPRILGPPMNEIFLGSRFVSVKFTPNLFFLRSENTAIYIKIDVLSHTLFFYKQGGL